MSDEKKYNTFRDLRAVTPKTPTSTTSPPSTTSIPSRASTSSKGVAPERDFQRVPNSITRHAVPSRLFRGKSKQVYDYLWSVSRGAVVPTRTVTKTRRDILKGAGLGSLVTVDAAVVHLQSVGLIRKRPAIGSPDGNEYEVFTYEETPPSSTSTPRTTSPTHNLVELDEPETSPTSTTQVLDSQRPYGPDKTSFKTSEQKLDDEAMPTLRSRVGKPMPHTEAVLLSLLDTLEDRTDVSSPDALLAHVLTRKFQPRATTARQRPSDEQFRGGRVEIEVSAEDLEEYERNRAELEGK